MNYLAHLFLSDLTPKSLVGNLLGDFMKGISETQYCEEIRQGILLHRKVDAYTDAHPIVRSSKQLISQSRQRFSGILIDIFYDHFLAKHWLDYSKISLYSFSQLVYRALQENQAILPDRLVRSLPDLIANNWLLSYGEISGIDRALQKLSIRVKYPNTLADSIEELEANYQQIELTFRAFFPDLIDYTQACRCKLI
jgi:acyl carrier protein phosphodiesterase